MHGEGARRGIRLLVINPNTNPAVTRRIRDVSERAAAPGTEVVVVNPEAGPVSIESVAEREAAVPEVLAVVAAHRGERYDGYVLACFDNIAVSELRGLVDGPVVSICEAGIAAARTLGRRFGIVTTVASALPVINDLIALYGVADSCRVRAAGIGVAAAAELGPAERRKLNAAMGAAISEDGAEAILLGSGALTGRADALAREFACPVVDGVAAAVKMAEGIAALRNGAMAGPRDRGSADEAHAPAGGGRA